jgi:rhodanese-related sulfurtransferase
MKRVLMVLLMMVTLAGQVWAAEKNVDSREVKKLLETSKNTYLIDVRTPQEYSQGRLPGATLIPISEFERHVAKVPRNKTIVVYCTVGARSKPVARYLSQLGYKDVLNMTDGLAGWSQNGFPVQR